MTTVVPASVPSVFHSCRRYVLSLATKNTEPLTFVSAPGDELTCELLPETVPGEIPENGIEIVDIRIRRLNYPAQVREAIFARIKSERSRQAARYRSKGVTEAENIKSESEAAISIQLTDARNRNKKKRAHADSEADLILNQAISKDRDYYSELKRRELGELAMDKAKVKVWSTQLFRLFFPALPPLEGSKPPPKAGGD